MSTATAGIIETSRTIHGLAKQEANEMTFVNEMISAEDRKKYGLDELDSSQEMRGRAPQRDWTIDHEREIYLRSIDRGREESMNWSKWHFYWHGELMTVCLEGSSGSDGQRGGRLWVRYQLVDCYRKGFFIPDHLLNRRDEIIADLKAALSRDTEGGVYSPSYYGTYETTLVI